MAMNPALLLRRAALAHPSRLALARGEGHISDYGTLARDVESLAASLRRKLRSAPG